jgi:hypothetical protein
MADSAQEETYGVLTGQELINIGEWLVMCSGGEMLEDDLLLALQEISTLKIHAALWHLAKTRQLRIKVRDGELVWSNL